MTRITLRRTRAAVEEHLVSEGVHPVLARLFASRGVDKRRDIDSGLDALLPPEGLLGIGRAAALLADAIAAQQRILIVADYDCDGATACAVGLRALRAMGAKVDYLVPDRFRYGYGLTPEIVARAAQSRPDMIVTVDNGIASVEGVDAANALGIPVVITDHHLPGNALPAAAAIVNPNQPGCGFASKAIAGVGVMFYVMLALRAELRRRGVFAPDGGPSLAELLDLVALGTVADVVRLDRNNRILVTQGLKRMRAGRLQVGLKALFAVAGRVFDRASTFDLGFAIGPRLNAAGRLDDMSLGIECLSTDDEAAALNIARRLDELNRERRGIEAGMKEQADALIERFDVGDRCSISLYDPAWHQGVVGIVAGRLKDRHHRPVFAFAPADAGQIRGSGRSINGLHLRDALDLVDKRAPGMLLRFGGHAAAAGVTLREADFARFEAALENAVQELIDPADLSLVTETDGPLEPSYLSLSIARMLEEQIWGQGFPQPVFSGEFAVRNQRIVGEKHLKLRLDAGGRTLEAMRFNSAEPLPARVNAAYRVSINEYNGVQSLQLVIDHWDPA
ncbi:MAG: single-stranded-DNA-specific exonuclease RecJ [Gammaproteobacteria bacterium RIFCSPLOWO2_02_FULL_61_13]|nr:MAG: single-stranded-DNA-specific exonuclease RecJ [Gammaproteobacteria bacterium RIFCSPLOWO2_02_FULL_61_13]